MEGPSLRAKENRMLERFEIAGLRHLRQGVSISFHVNKSGIMEASYHCQKCSRVDCCQDN